MDTPDKWKFPVTLRIVIALLCAGWAGNSWTQSIKDHSDDNTLMLARKMDVYMHKQDSINMANDYFKKAQFDWNTQEINFRNSVINKFGWR